MLTTEENVVERVHKVSGINDQEELASILINGLWKLIQPSCSPTRKADFTASPELAIIEREKKSKMMISECLVERYQDNSDTI